MSFNPATGFVYIPVIEAPMIYINTANRPAGYADYMFETQFMYPEDYDPAALKSLFGTLPPLKSLLHGSAAEPKSRSVLRAFDPVRKKVAWEAPGFSIWDGGVLSTGGNLVLRGDAAGILNVYAADSGRRLTQVDVGTSMMAAPMTYRVNGTQYVAVMAGYGGGLLFSPFPAGSAAQRYGNAGRIVAFKLDGGTVPKPPAAALLATIEPPPRIGTASDVAHGAVLYNRYCARCHVLGQGLLPDLRRLDATTHAIFKEIVLHGAYGAKGMARWDDVLSVSDAAAIHAYVIDQAWAQREATQGGGPH